MARRLNYERANRRDVRNRLIGDNKYSNHVYGPRPDFIQQTKRLHMLGAIVDGKFWQRGSMYRLYFRGHRGFVIFNHQWQFECRGPVPPPVRELCNRLNNHCLRDYDKIPWSADERQSQEESL